MKEIDIRLLDMTLLLVFQEVMASGKSTVAASRLGLTQPAISHALKRLRSIFDEELFVRRSAGLEPTAFARELAPKVAAILALTRDALERTPAEAAGGGLGGTIGHV